MSWEIDREETKKCPCGKGTYTIQHRSDDWNRFDERWFMNCEECKEQYEVKNEYTYRSGLQEVCKTWVKK